MNFYYLVIAFVFFIYLFVYKSKLLCKKTLFVYCTFFFLIIISSIRADSVGGDLQHYIPRFTEFGKQNIGQLLGDRTKYGWIYALYCKLAYTINSNNQSFLFFTSIFNLSFVAYFIRKYSPKPLLSIFLYITFAFYTNTFNSVRSSMALGIGLLLFKYILERKIGWFIFYYLIALEIHQTFFPFFILYPLCQMKINLKYIIFSILTCFIVSQLSSHIEIISLLAFAYDPGAYANIGENYSGGYNLLLLMCLITISMYMINKDKLYIDPKLINSQVNVNENNIIRLFLHSMVVACCILCFATYYTVLTRVAMFFYIVIIILIPITINNFRYKNIKGLCYWITCLLFLVYFSLFVMRPLENFDNSNSQMTIPYKTYWEK